MKFYQLWLSPKFPDISTTNGNFCFPSNDSKVQCGCSHTPFVELNKNDLKFHCKKCQDCSRKFIMCIQIIMTLRKVAIRFNPHTS